MQPVVSVIMASYNSAPYIAAAICSVLRQSITEVELIVVDDASTDATPEIVKKIAEIDQRIKLIATAKNSGPSAARNLALEQVRGRWVAIMDSDDLMSPERLERLIAIAEEDNIDVVADNPLLFWDDRSSPPQLHLELSAPVTVGPVDLVNNANKFGYLKTVFRSARLGHIRYDESIYVGEDFDYYLRCLVAGATFRIYPIPSYFYRQHNRPASSARTRRAVETMLASNIAFRSEFVESSALSMACKTREDGLRSFLNYLDLTSFLKHKNFLRASYFVLRNPSSLLTLKAPIKARLTRLRKFLNADSSMSNWSPALEESVDQILRDSNSFIDRLCY